MVPHLIRSESLAELTVDLVVSPPAPDNLRVFSSTEIQVKFGGMTIERRANWDGSDLTLTSQMYPESDTQQFPQ